MTWRGSHADLYDEEGEVTDAALAALLLVGCIALLIVLLIVI